MFRMMQLSHKFSDLSNLRAWVITTAKANYAEIFTYTVWHKIYIVRISQLLTAPKIRSAMFTDPIKSTRTIAHIAFDNIKKF